VTSKLTITGAVGEPLALDADALRSRPSVVADASTVAEGAVGVAVRVAELIADASPSPQATHCTVIGDAGSYRASIPLDDLVAGGWLAFGLDKGPLPDARGGPFRLTVAAGETLCWNVKRVDALELTVGPVADDVPENPPH
jgi:DMSO/TMAO reductase YedYZ molybdopterin-dependent catalytic subunit